MLRAVNHESGDARMGELRHGRRALSLSLPVSHDDAAIAVANVSGRQMSHLCVPRPRYLRRPGGIVELSHGQRDTSLNIGRRRVRCGRIGGSKA